MNLEECKCRLIEFLETSENDEFIVTLYNFAENLIKNPNVATFLIDLGNSIKEKQGY